MTCLDYVLYCPEEDIFTALFDNGADPQGIVIQCDKGYNRNGY